MRINNLPPFFGFNLPEKSGNDLDPSNVKREQIYEEKGVDEDNIYDLDVKLEEAPTNPPEGEQCYTLRNCATGGSQCCQYSQNLTHCNVNSCNRCW